jgi:hypothetical protein
MILKTMLDCNEKRVKRVAQCEADYIEKKMVFTEDHLSSTSHSHLRHLSLFAPGPHCGYPQNDKKLEGWTIL